MKSRVSPGEYVIAATAWAIFVCGHASAQQQTRDSAATGAGWGALAGLVFGGELSDVVEGAVVGGVAGAVVGSAKAQDQAAVEQARIARAREIREQDRIAYEQEAQRRAMVQADYERRLQDERGRLGLARTGSAQPPAKSPLINDPKMLTRAFGEDTVAGLYALRDCRHDYALIAATAGENSTVASHQLAAVWLRAIIALDQNRMNSANATYQYLIEIDPEVSTVDEAHQYAQELLVEVRADRSATAVSCTR